MLPASAADLAKTEFALSGRKERHVPAIRSARLLHRLLMRRAALPTVIMPVHVLRLARVPGFGLVLL